VLVAEGEEVAVAVLVDVALAVRVALALGETVAVGEADGEAVMVSVAVGELVGVSEGGLRVLVGLLVTGLTTRGVLDGTGDAVSVGSAATRT
jgi:hypothetical protein